MRKETAVVALLFSLVSLAGCFGDGDGTTNTVERDCGTKSFDLYVTSTTNSEIPLYTLNDGVTEQRVVAITFQAGDGNPENIESPSPPIVLMECQSLQLTLHNTNPMPHTLHLHGGLVDWTMDGVPFLSQLPVMQGESKTYVFEDLKAGTYWYHCHVDVAHHIDLGMYGAFIVKEWEPVHESDEDLLEHVLMFDEWDNCHVHGGSTPPPREDIGGIEDDQECRDRQFTDVYHSQGYWRNLNTAQDPLCQQDLPPEIRDQLNCGADTPPDQSVRTWYPMTFPVYRPEYNTFTINSKAFPDTKPIFMEEGKSYRLRLINVGEEVHSLHLHGHKMQVAYRDGYALDAPFYVDTISIAPGERYDVIVEADNPGFWAFHDHIGLNVMNDYHSPGGMFTVLAYTGDFADSVGFEPTPEMRAIEVMDFTMQYHMQNQDSMETSRDAQPLRAITLPGGGTAATSTDL